MSSESDFVELERKRARKKRRRAQLHSQLNEWRLAAALPEQTFADPRNLIESATRLAPHVPLPQEVCDYLYPLSRCPLAREEWDKQVGVCIAIRALLDAHVSKINDFVGLLDAAAVRQLVERVSQRATLFLINHGGAALLSRAAFTEMFNEGTTIAWRQQDQQAYSAMQDPAAALFAGRRALLEGSPLLMAPDGVLTEGQYRLAGNQKTPLSGLLVRNQKIRMLDILGLEWPVSDGAAFLAYDTRCDTVWFTIAVADEGLTPVAIDGSRRRDGERFAEFQDRFWRFYAEQIEMALTGDPRNLPIGRLPSLLARARLRSKEN